MINEKMKDVIDFTIALTIVLTIIIIATTGIYYYTKWANKVVSSQYVGTALNTTFIDSYTYTRVETDLGVFLVNGIFQVVKGHRLEMKIHKDNTRYLCDDIIPQCLQLAK